MNRGVYYNAETDETNVRGAGSTYFHELAHMIDNAATGYVGNISNNSDFREALLEDGERILEAYNSASQAVRQNFVRDMWQNNQTHSFQDLVDATTNGGIPVRWGHTREYWMIEGNLQAEAFAHFFEASMGEREKLSRLEQYFPSAYAIFRNLIKDIADSEHIRILELRRPNVGQTRIPGRSI